MVGGGDSPATAELSLNVLDFHRRASGRISRQQALQQGLVNLYGDQALAHLALQNTVVLY